jgi:hypothetical protein
MRSAPVECIQIKSPGLALISQKSAAVFASRFPISALRVIYMFQSKADECASQFITQCYQNGNGCEIIMCFLCIYIVVIYISCSAASSASKVERVKKLPRSSEDNGQEMNLRL